MDAKTLEAWRAMAEASTPGLEAASVSLSGCFWIRDEDTAYGNADGNDATAKANAKLWAASRGIVLALIAEVERLQAKVDECDCDYCRDWALAVEKEKRADEHRAAMDDKEKERREERTP